MHELFRLPRLLPGFDGPGLQSALVLKPLLRLNAVLGAPSGTLRVGLRAGPPPPAGPSPGGTPLFHITHWLGGAWFGGAEVLNAIQRGEKSVGHKGAVLGLPK